MCQSFFHHHLRAHRWHTLFALQVAWGLFSSLQFLHLYLWKCENVLERERERACTAVLVFVWPNVNSIKLWMVKHFAFSFLFLNFSEWIVCGWGECQCIYVHVLGMALVNLPFYDSSSFILNTQWNYPSLSHFTFWVFQIRKH